MDEIRLSASYLQDYLDCQAKAYFRRYRANEVEKGSALYVGSIVHDVAERCKTLESGLEYAQSQYLGYNLMEKDIEKAERCIKNLFSEQMQILTTPEDEIEKKFKVKFDDGVYIIGMLDRILPYGRIIDWKTNARSFSKHTVQSLLYIWAYKQLHGGREPVDFVFGFLSPGKTETLKPDNRLEKILIEETIPHIIENIIVLKNYPRNGEFNGSCFMCGYKSICKDYELDS